jgi:hypothetical protein
LEVLGFDANVPRDLDQYKERFDEIAVRKIHEAILEVWPPDTDIASALAATDADVSGLYIGDYHLDYILRGIVRHSTYANKILIVDPFIYPKSVRDEFNPIIEPRQYRTQTLKNVNFYMSILPWVEAGIVEVIRTPADFDTKLNWESMKRQKKKYDEVPELKEAIEQTTNELSKTRSSRKSTSPTWISP